VATERHVLLTDDLTGEKGVKTYAFSLRSTQYEIELTDAHRDDMLRALAPYIDVARKVPKGRLPTTPSS